MTRRGTAFLVATVFVCLFAMAGTGAAQNVKGCTIQRGTILDEHGVPLSTGYDEYGYNYGAHNFGGFYNNWTRPEPPQYSPWQWADDQLNMSWNDAWLSNKDSDCDGVLDRPDSYRGSGATVVIHIGGMCTDNHFNQWSHQLEISAVPVAAKIAQDGSWSFAGKKLGQPLTIVFYDTLHGITWSDNGFVVTKDNFSNSCPNEGNHPSLFAVPVGPFESATFVR